MYLARPLRSQLRHAFSQPSRRCRYRRFITIDASMADNNGSGSGGAADKKGSKDDGMREVKILMLHGKMSASLWGKR